MCTIEHSLCVNDIRDIPVWKVAGENISETKQKRHVCCTGYWQWEQWKRKRNQRSFLDIVAFILTLTHSTLKNRCLIVLLHKAWMTHSWHCILMMRARRKKKKIWTAESSWHCCLHAKALRSTENRRLKLDILWTFHSFMKPQVFASLFHLCWFTSNHSSTALCSCVLWNYVFPFWHCNNTTVNGTMKTTSTMAKTAATIKAILRFWSLSTTSVNSFIHMVVFCKQIHQLGCHNCRSKFGSGQHSWNISSSISLNACWEITAAHGKTAADATMETKFTRHAHDFLVTQDRLG